MFTSVKAKIRSNALGPKRDIKSKAKRVEGTLFKRSRVGIITLERGREVTDRIPNKAPNSRDKDDDKKAIEIEVLPPTKVRAKRSLPSTSHPAICSSVGFANALSISISYGEGKKMGKIEIEMSIKTNSITPIFSLLFTPLLPSYR